MNVGTGEVLHQTRKTHTGEDVLACFRWIDLHTPCDLEIHVVLDNLSAHKSAEVTQWLADRMLLNAHVPNLQMGGQV